METLQTTISFDDLDLLTTVLEGFTQSLDSDDEDRPAIEALLQNLSDFCDKACYTKIIDDFAGQGA